MTCFCPYAWLASPQPWTSKCRGCTRQLQGCPRCRARARTRAAAALCDPPGTSFSRGSRFQWWPATPRVANAHLNAPFVAHQQPCQSQHETGAKDPREMEHPAYAHLVGCVKLIVHKPRDDACLPHRLVPQKHQLVLHQGRRGRHRAEHLPFGGLPLPCNKLGCC